jgi:hypothetical protein
MNDRRQQGCPGKIPGGPVLAHREEIKTVSEIFSDLCYIVG